MANSCIIGIGNPYRGDDGIGWAVIDQLQGKVDSTIHLIKERGDITLLLDLFGRYDTVYLVDACHGLPKGHSWERIEPLLHPIPTDLKQTSTHGLNLSQAIALGTRLNQLPSKLIIYAIEATTLNKHTALSKQSKEALQSVLCSLLLELQGNEPCMKQE